jgi:hypothetical protein
VEEALRHCCPRLAGGHTTPHSTAALAAAAQLEYWTKPVSGPDRTGWDHLGLSRHRRGWVRFVLLVLCRVGLPSVVYTIVLSCLRRFELGLSEDAAEVRRERLARERALEWPADS